MIGYYVHHHGHGHLTRALAVCAHLDEPVVFFSSLPRPPGLRDGDLWVALPLDVPADGAVVDATVGGRLHWAPLHVDGLAERSAELLRVIAQNPLRRFVVDVSVEIALLVRLAGVPVTVLCMPGERHDVAHRLAYDIADQIIAPWSERMYRPEWLVAHRSRTSFVGAISRFDGRRLPDSDGTAPPSAVLLTGAGGADIPEDALSQLRRALPRYRWSACGGATWVDDPWSILAGAEVIVTHAGQNAVADVALTGAAAIVIPQSRPFEEQRVTADALVRAGVTVRVDGWPATQDWPDLVLRTAALPSSRWDALAVTGAAARAAAVIAA